MYSNMSVILHIFRLSWTISIVMRLVIHMKSNLKEVCVNLGSSVSESYSIDVKNKKPSHHLTSSSDEVYFTVVIQIDRARRGMRKWEYDTVWLRKWLNSYKAWQHFLLNSRHTSFVIAEFYKPDSINKKRDAIIAFFLLVSLPDHQEILHWDFSSRTIQCVCRRWGAKNTHTQRLTELGLSWVIHTSASIPSCLHLCNFINSVPCLLFCHFSNDNPRLKNGHIWSSRSLTGNLLGQSIAVGIILQGLIRRIDREVAVARLATAEMLSRQQPLVSRQEKDYDG